MSKATFDIHPVNLIKLQIMKSKKTNAYSLSGLVIILFLGITVFSCHHNKKDEKNEWVTTQAVRQDLSRLVTCTGSLEPITEVEVGTQVSGRVEKIYVDYNSEVTKGELLAELDQTVLSANLSSAESSMESAKIQMDYEQKNFERYKVLYEKQLVSSADYESAHYSYESAKNNYIVRRNDYQTAKTNLGYAKIYSPIDGIVLSRTVEEGQTVAASFSTPTLFTIANDLTKMRVIGDVDEADIGFVLPGQYATFTVDAFPDIVFEGEVTEVRLSAITTNNVVTYEVVINAPNPDLKLKPGLTATVSIYTLQKKKVLVIPTEALSFSPDTQQALQKNQGKNYVWVLNGNQPLQREIEIGDQSGSLSEVVSGLSEGEAVILSGNPSSINYSAPSKDTTGNDNSSPFMPKPPSGRRGGGGAPR